MKTRLAATLGVAFIASTTFAGDTTRFDVAFSDFDIFYFDDSGNRQVIATNDGGRYFDSFGWSNVDVDVCWNSPAAYSSWASEVRFGMTMDDGTGTARVMMGSPFPGVDSGAQAPDTCINYQNLVDADTPLLPFTYSVDASGDVAVGMYASWNDTTGQRHSHCNTADYFFTLAGTAPSGCDGAVGACDEAHETPGCDDLTCCAITCDPNQGGDPFCCQDSWDSTCSELAISLCGLFQYSCGSSAYPNDCATSPIVLANGESVEFSTVGANYDGPIIECASGGAANVWYLVEIDTVASQRLIVSTCNAATYDTALNIYDMGAIGSAFNLNSLPNVNVICNDDGAGCAGYTSLANVQALPGRQYLIAVSGYNGESGSGTLTVSWEDEEAPRPAPECATPGDTTVSQFVVAPEDLQWNGGVWCGVSGVNKTCRMYPASMFGGAFDVQCVDFYTYIVEDLYLPSEVNLYRSNQDHPVGATLELLGESTFGLYGPYIGLGSQSFETPVTVDLAEGEYLMVELVIHREVGGGDFYGGYGGISSGDTDGTDGFWSCSGDYASMTEAGFPEYQPYLVLNGTAAGGNPCPADFNGDGQVTGADFGALLAAWGTCSGCPEDLNGDGQVNGADVGGMLAAWGACP